MKPVLLLKALALTFAMMCLPSTFVAYAQDYSSGHGALEIWDDAAQENVPLWIWIWLRILILTFVAGLFFVWSRIEARWAVGGLIGLIAAISINKAWIGLVPLSGLIGLFHIVFWSPVLYLLLTRRPFLKERSLYAVWSGVLTIVILFSFIFDIRDAAIYLDHAMKLGVLS